MGISDFGAQKLKEADSTSETGIDNRVKIKS